jgi:UDP:flavonoid glycosyltransferase YjiC (YdhE family)
MRVLLVAEAVTLAHVARPAALARLLDPQRYEMIFAAADRYRSLFGDLAAPWRTIHSIPSKQFQDALARGRPLHDEATLRAYVREDLALIEDVRPDVVIGDLRQSLSVSARVARVPFIALMNAYWSPYGRQHFPVPSVPAARLLGTGVAQALFNVIRPFAFAQHSVPLNRIRREYGLGSVGSDLRRVYTDADFVVYPDGEQLIPTYGLPPNHRYIGPLLWSPSLKLPEWWDDLPTDRPLVYVTLGSSGNTRLLSSVVDALATEPVVVMAAVVEARSVRLPENVWHSDFLPGIEAAQRADVVICNGGSPTAQQALAAGKPVIGLPANLDQHLNMDYVVRAGAGRSVRSENASVRAVRAAVREVLRNPAYTKSAARLRDGFAQYDAARAISEVLEEIRARNHSQQQA